MWNQGLTQTISTPIYPGVGIVHVDPRFYPQNISKSGINMGVGNTWPSLDIIFTNKREGGAVIRAGTPIQRYMVYSGVTGRSQWAQKCSSRRSLQGIHV